MNGCRQIGKVTQTQGAEGAEGNFLLVSLFSQRLKALPNLELGMDEEEQKEAPEEEKVTESMPHCSLLSLTAQGTWGMVYAGGPNCGHKGAHVYKHPWAVP